MCAKFCPYVLFTWLKCQIWSLLDRFLQWQLQSKLIHTCTHALSKSGKIWISLSLAYWRHVKSRVVPLQMWSQECAYIFLWLIWSCLATYMVKFIHYFKSILKNKPHKTSAGYDCTETPSYKPYYVYYIQVPISICYSSRTSPSMHFNNFIVGSAITLLRPKHVASWQLNNVI